MAPTLQLIIDKMDAGFSSIKSELSTFRQEVSTLRVEVDSLKTQLSERDQRITLLEQRISALENSTSGIAFDVRNLEFSDHRFKVRLYKFPGLDNSYPMVRANVIDFRQKIGIESRKIFDIRVLNLPRGKQVLVIFTSTELANYLCLNFETYLR